MSVTGNLKSKNSTIFQCVVVYNFVFCFFNVTLYLNHFYKNKILGKFEVKHVGIS